VEPCDKFKRRAYTKERKNLTIKVTTDCASILYRKEEWEEEDNIRLLVSQWADSEEQLSIATYFRYYQEH